MSLMKYASGKYQYIPVRTQGDCSRNSFLGSISLSFTVPEMKNWDPANSYFSIQMNMLGRTGGVNVLIGNNAVNTTNNTTNTACLSSDPCACLFSKISDYINDTNLSSIENVAQIDQAKNMLFESQATIDKGLSTNPIYWRSVQQPAYDANIGGIIDTYTELTYLQETRIQAQQSPLWYAGTCRFNWKPPLAIFQSSEPVPSGVRYRMTLNVDPNYRNRVVFGQRGGVALNVTSIGGLNADGQIGLDITDIILYMATYESVVKVPKQINYVFSEIFSSIHSIPDSSFDKFSFVIPRGTYKVIIGFFDGRVGTSTLFSPTDFSCPGNNLRQNLRELTLTYAGENYPMQTLNLQDFRATSPWTAATNLEDLARLYYETLLSSDSFRDSSSSALSFKEFLINPLFCYKIIKPPGDLSSNLDVYCRFAANVQNVAYFVMCLYNNEVSIKFDDYGFVSSVENEQLI